ncbi:MAG TPA: hypothetical protein ENN19_06735 [Chloroflexi bacterium]|nr:hypothetical protein [Chloroflexota bacterium]
MLDVVLDLFGQEAWLYLAGSLLLAVIGSNVAWLFRKPRLGALGEMVARFAVTPFAAYLFQLLRLFYYLGVPFAALFWGQDAVVARILGLQPLIIPLSGERHLWNSVSANWLGWVRDAGWLAAMGVVGLAGLALVGYSYRRALAATGLKEEAINVIGLDRSASELLFEAAYHEVHWAFYRNAPVLWLQRYVSEGMYWGVWLGLVLVAFEAALNPFWRQGIADRSKAPMLLMRGGWALVSAVFFLVTQNLCLAIVLHWGVSWGWTALMRQCFSSRTPEPDRSTI